MDTSHATPPAHSCRTTSGGSSWSGPQSISSSGRVSSGQVANASAGVGSGRASGAMPGDAASNAAAHSAQSVHPETVTSPPDPGEDHARDPEPHAVLGGLRGPVADPLVRLVEDVLVRPPGLREVGAERRLHLRAVDVAGEPFDVEPVDGGGQGEATLDCVGRAAPDVPALPQEPQQPVGRPVDRTPARRRPVLPLRRLDQPAGVLGGGVQVVQRRREGHAGDGADALPVVRERLRRRRIVPAVRPARRVQSDHHPAPPQPVPVLPAQPPHLGLGAPRVRAARIGELHEFNGHPGDATRPSPPLERGETPGRHPVGLRVVPRIRRPIP